MNPAEQRIVTRNFEEMGNHYAGHKDGVSWAWWAAAAKSAVKAGDAEWANKRQIQLRLQDGFVQFVKKTRAEIEEAQ
jgi:hypothetical protein